MASRRSQPGLDWLNFFVADLQTGFGPFVAVYLTAQAWTDVEIGVALSVGTATMMLAQVPAGLLVDATPRKRLLAMIAMIGIALSAILLAAWPARLPHGPKRSTSGTNRPWRNSRRRSPPNAVSWTSW